MTTAIEIHGICDEKFTRVRDALAENFATHGEVGAALAVMVVDLWAGHADAAQCRAWERDTLVNVYSTTKGMTALCAHRLVERGLLDLDAPVARYWPEFAQGGKGELPVRYLLSHRAGLPALSEPLPPGSLYNWEVMTSALAKQEPWWEPGTKHGYHALTYGWLVGEVVRRISRKSLGTFFRDEVAEPLGLDFHIGLASNHNGRTAEVIPPVEADLEDGFLSAILSDPESMSYKSFSLTEEPIDLEQANTPEWRAAEIPAANGHGSARAVARVYGVLARGGELEDVRVLGASAIESAIVEQSDGPDAVLLLPSRFGMGFMLTQPELQLGPNEHAFGHSGLRGSLGFADRDAKLGFGYTMNKMIVSADLVDPRWPAMFDAVYGSL